MPCRGESVRSLDPDHDGRIVEAVRKYKRVLQTGLQQRSGGKEYHGIMHVRNGTIGKITRVLASNYASPMVPRWPKQEIPKGLDWDFWCGPAEPPPYNFVIWDNRSNPSWVSVRPFSGGNMTDRGGHGLDMVQWGLGMDASGPVEILPAPGGTQAKRGVKLVYANGVTVEHKNGFGVHFFGSEGEIQVNRGRFVFTRDGQVISKFTRREDGERGRRVEVGREERREEHHLAGDEQHHPQQGRVHPAALGVVTGLDLLVAHLRLECFGVRRHDAAPSLSAAGSGVGP